MTAHIRCMAVGVHDPRLSGRCNYDIRRRMTPYDALWHPLTTEFAVVRFKAAYFATRRHETPRDDIIRLDTTFIKLREFGSTLNIQHSDSESWFNIPKVPSQTLGEK